MPETTICEKAHVIYGDWKENVPSTSKGAAQDTSKASHGWFRNFKTRTGIHLMIGHGEAASVYVKGDEEHIARIVEHVAQDGCILQQEFNCMMLDCSGRNCQED